MPSALKNGDSFSTFTSIGARITISAFGSFFRVRSTILPRLVVAFSTTPTVSCFMSFTPRKSSTIAASALPSSALSSSSIALVFRPFLPAFTAVMAALFFPSCVTQRSSGAIFPAHSAWVIESPKQRIFPWISRGLRAAGGAASAPASAISAAAGALAAAIGAEVVAAASSCPAGLVHPARVSAAAAASWIQAALRISENMAGHGTRDRQGARHQVSSSLERFSRRPPAC